MAAHLLFSLALPLPITRSRAPRRLLLHYLPQRIRITAAAAAAPPRPNRTAASPPRPPPPPGRGAPASPSARLLAPAPRSSPPEVQGEDG
ncbi:unnamed protein product [Urochloa humidicola]